MIVAGGSGIHDDLTLASIERCKKNEEVNQRQATEIETGRWNSCVVFLDKDEVDMEQTRVATTFELTRMPWVALLIWWGLGFLWLYFGTLIPRRELFMQVMFTGGGYVAIIGGLFLPKVSIRVEPREKTLVRVWGPWLGLWRRTLCVPIDSITEVRYYRSVRNVRNKGFRQTFNLCLTTIGGGYVPLFPPTFTPRRAPMIGQVLAEALGVEFHGL